MKTIREKIYSGALLLGAVAFLASCSDADKDCGTGDGEDTVYDISRVMLEMTETETDSPEAVTRATGFVVNTDSDPTYSLTAKHGWTLALVIYDKDGDPYDEGQGTLTWDGSYWTSDTQLYMPNYLMQNVSAELYPSTWTPGVSTIETDQSTEADFLRQDILVQDGEPTYQTAPAHYLEVRMRHAHSMLDIVLANVDPTHIVSVEIIAGGNTYNPYKAGVTSREEYMVILPVGSMNPVIEVTTQAGGGLPQGADNRPDRHKSLLLRAAGGPRTGTRSHHRIQLDLRRSRPGRLHGPHKLPDLPRHREHPAYRLLRQRYQSDPQFQRPGRGHREAPRPYYYQDRIRYARLRLLRTAIYPDNGYRPESVHRADVLTVIYGT